MFDSNLTTSLSSAIRAAATASDMAPVLEDLRYKIPTGYGVARPADGIARPVEDIIVANEQRGVTAAVNTALLALHYARHNLLAAVESMNEALALHQSTAK